MIVDVWAEKSGGGGEKKDRYRTRGAKERKRREEGEIDKLRKKNCERWKMCGRVCMRDRERERERKGKRERERKRERETEREGERDIEILWVGFV